MKKQSNTLLFFGDTLKTFGAGGELIVKLSTDAPEKINTKEPIFITIDGLSVPFYFKSVEAKGNHKLVVVFDDMETEETAMELVGKKLYYVSKQKAKTKAPDLSNFIGYTLVDNQLGKLGKITDFFDFPGNPCFQFFYNEKEVLIPINEDFIKDSNATEQTLVLDLPEGLIDIYLDN